MPLLRTSFPILYALCCAFLFAASPAFAGGFFITAELPTAADHPKDAALILSIVGCHKPGALSAKAEGVVNGERMSVPLRLEPLPDGGYSVKRSWPEKGVWVISVYALAASPVVVQGKTLPLYDAVLFPLDVNGQPRRVWPYSVAGSTTRQLIEGRRISVDPKKKVREINDALRAALRERERLTDPALAAL